MKVLRTLVLGLGILLGCGCNRPTKTHYSATTPSTTYGTYMGQGYNQGYTHPQTLTRPHYTHPSQGYGSQHLLGSTYR